MEQHWASMALLFGLTLIVSLALTPLVRRLALKRNLLDRPGEARRVHRVPVPRLGGLAMYAAFVVGVLLTFVLPVRQGQVGNAVHESSRVIFMLIGATLVTLVMAVDDVKGLKPLPRLIMQVVAALIVVVPSLITPGSANPGDPAGTIHYDQGAGVLATTIQSPFGGTIYLPLVVAIFFTVFWITGMTNTINWIDGLDGLAGGVSLLACSVLFYVTGPVLHQYSLAYLPLILGAAILGFLPYNIHPARIFMGDSGAMFLGYTLAIISIIGGAKVAAALLVLGVPILDAAYLIVFRILRGKSPMSSDRGHLHHRLLDIGLSQQRVVWVFYLFSAVFGVLAFLLPSGLSKLYALGIMVLVLVVLLAIISRRTFDRPRLRRR